jgi:putative membrane protein
MRLFSILILSLTALIGISFAVLNAQPVLVNYYFGTREIPLSLLLLMVLILGILIGLFSLYPRIVRLKLEVRRLRRSHG